MHVGVDHMWHDRLVIAAAAAATLAVIAAPALAGLVSGVGLSDPHDPDEALTDMGRLVLEEAEHAYRIDDTVIVSAVTDSSIIWADDIPDERIVGNPVPLGVRGLADYGNLPTSSQAPVWARAVDATDRVMADVGTVFFACTRFYHVRDCAPSLLMQHEGELYTLVAGIGSADFLRPGAPMEAFTQPVLVHAEMGMLVIGAIRQPYESRVVVEFDDGEKVDAWTTRTTLPEATVWWTASSKPVHKVTAYGADQEVIDAVTFG
jgi:hypothetical protein